MAVVELIDLDARNTFLKTCVETNIGFWQDYLDDNEADVSALDQEWEGIVKAIALGLQLQTAWPEVYDLIRDFADFMERRGHWAAWQSLLDQAQQLAPERDDKADLVTLYALAARLYQRQGDIGRMVAAHRRTLRFARRYRDRFNEARTCTNLGYYYVEDGHWYRAEVLCCHALQIFEALDSDHGRAHTENHLGALYTRQGQWQEAETRLQKACALWEKMGDQHGLMYGLMNLGVLYIDLDDFEAALIYAKKALQQARLTGDELMEGTIYINCGNAARLNGQLRQAEQYIHQGEAIFRHFNHTRGLALATENLGMVYLYQQRWDEAAALLKSALEMWIHLKNAFREIRTLALLTTGYLIDGDPHQANRWLYLAYQKLDQHGTKNRLKPLQSWLDELQDCLDKNIRPSKVVK